MTAEGSDNQLHKQLHNAFETNGVKVMGLILFVLLLALLFGGLGFAIHALWVVAVVVFIAWLIGFGVARGEGAGGRARWYRW